MPGGFAGFPFGPGSMPSGGSTRTFRFSTGGASGAGGFSFSDPNHIFADFFRSAAGDDIGDMPDFGAFGSRMGGMGGMGGMPDMAGRKGSRSGSSRFADMNGAPRAPTPEVTVLEKPLPVTLEELFKGTTKKMKIKRKKYDPATQKQTVEDRILEVPIRAGLKAGSKIKFKDVGDQVEGGTQDLHFVVEEVGQQPENQTDVR